MGKPDGKSIPVGRSVGSGERKKTSATPCIPAAGGRVRFESDVRETLRRWCNFGDQIAHDLFVGQRCQGHFARLQT